MFFFFAILTFRAVVNVCPCAPSFRTHRCPRAHVIIKPIFRSKELSKFSIVLEEEEEEKTFHSIMVEFIWQLCNLVWSIDKCASTFVSHSFTEKERHSIFH